MATRSGSAPFINEAHGQEVSFKFKSSKQPSGWSGVSILDVFPLFRRFPRDLFEPKTARWLLAARISRFIWTVPVWPCTAPCRVDSFACVYFFSQLLGRVECRTLSISSSSDSRAEQRCVTHLRRWPGHPDLSPSPPRRFSLAPLVQFLNFFYMLLYNWVASNSGPLS